MEMLLKKLNGTRNLVCLRVVLGVNYSVRRV